MTKFQKVKPFFIFVVLFIFLIAGSSSVLCKKLSVNPNDYRAEEYPEYEQYFEEYINRIKEVYTPEKYFNLTVDSHVKFLIKPDGSISDFKVYYSTEDLYSSDITCYVHQISCSKRVWHGKKFNKYIKNLVYSVPPKPFPKEIEHESMLMDLGFIYIAPSKKLKYYTEQITDDPPFSWRKNSGHKGACWKQVYLRRIQ